MVVDDVPQNVRLLDAVLTSHGYAVTPAASGPEALEKVAEDGPDLVLLDVQMPELNGYEVCRRLREDAATRFLPAAVGELGLTQGEGILESHRREIAVLFADLRGWTAFSMNTEPEEVIGVIRDFHGAMGNLWRRRGHELDFSVGIGLGYATL